MRSDRVLIRPTTRPPRRRAGTIGVSSRVSASRMRISDVEASGVVGIAGGHEQLAVRTEVTLDVRARAGQQSGQYPARRLAMQPVLGRRGLLDERLVEETDADADEPAQVAEGLGRPGAVLDHLGEQRQADGRDRRRPGVIIATARSMNVRCSSLGSPRAGRGASRTPRRSAASTFRACAGGKRSTAAAFSPSTTGTSSCRMNRPVAIQKSTRTMSERLEPIAVALPQGAGPARPPGRPSWRAATARTGPARSGASTRAGAPSLGGPPRGPRPAWRRGRSPGTPVGSGRGAAARGRSSPPRRSRSTRGASRGSSPALTIDDLPQPDGP